MKQNPLVDPESRAKLRTMPLHVIAAYMREFGWEATEPSRPAVPEEHQEAIAFLTAPLRFPEELKKLFPGHTHFKGLKNVAFEFDICWMWELLLLDDNPFKAKLFGGKTHELIVNRARDFGLPYAASHYAHERMRPDRSHPLMVLARQVRPSHKDSRA